MAMVPDRCLFNDRTGQPKASALVEREHKVASLVIRDRQSVRRVARRSMFSQVEKTPSYP